MAMAPWGSPYRQRFFPVYRVRESTSSLKAAFEGGLVPQDPTDEPASALLAYLRSTEVTGRASGRRRMRRADKLQVILNI
jgi:hypothetical protein